MHPSTSAFSQYAHRLRVACDEEELSPNPHSQLYNSTGSISSRVLYEDVIERLRERSRDSGIIGSVVSKEFDKFHEYFHQPNDDIIGAIVSTFAGGCFFGAAAAGWLANSIGRKRTVQSEIAPPHMRGLLTGLTQWMIGLGFLAANWVGYGCQFLKNDGQWRIPLAIQIIPAVLLLLGMFFLPFSPRWLIAQGREDEAWAVVQRLHGNLKNEEFTKLEFAEMVEQIKYEKANYQTKFSDLWASKAMIRRTLTGMAVQICCQFTGINVSAYFQPTLYRALGLSGPKVLMITGINGALGVIVTGVFITFILDRVGRKPPLIFGAIGMAVCLAIEAAINAKWGGEHSTNRAAQQAGIAFIIGPPSKEYATGEIEDRMTDEYTRSVLISQVSPIGMTKLGYRFYIVFVVTNIVNGLIVIAFFPETKGKSLEEMDEVFGDQAIPHALETKAAHNIHDDHSSEKAA
ncbi:hypothetical protein FRC17_011118, partial [Serendipita sp. 399]